MLKFYAYNLLSLVLGCIFLYLDLLMPLGFAGGVPYIALILIGLHAESSKLIIVNLILGLFFTITGFYFSPETADMTVAAFNRMLAIGTLCLTAYFCFMNLRLIEERYQASVLRSANEKLKTQTGFVRLNRDISWIANMADTLESGVRQSLQKICEFTDWQVGHLYLPDNNGESLLPTNVWYFDNEGKFKTFRDITHRSPLSPGEGLPGRVLIEGKPQFINDLKNDPNFPRGALSKEIGVFSGFGFPIFIEKQAVGVMEFFSTKPMEFEEGFTEVMENIGVLLGRLVERSRADEEKRKYSDHLRKLYHRLDFAREEESKRIAREIHDNLGQLLTAMKIELALLNNKLLEKEGKTEESIQLMFDLIDKNIQVVREISQDLRPPVLDALSFCEAVGWQGRQFEEKTGVKFNLSTSPSVINVDLKKSSALYRIFQECLTNIARHSRASEVNVDIIDEGNYILMRVDDNGVGIAREKIRSVDSIGLLGMRERAQVWGGDVMITGVENEGTTVTIKI